MKGYNSTSNKTVAKVKHHEPTSITLITSGTTHAALFTEKNMTDEVPPMLRSEVARVSIDFARKLSFSSASQVSRHFRRPRDFVFWKKRWVTRSLPHAKAVVLVCHVFLGKRCRGLWYAVDAGG
jgi:hypothetical protein